MKNDSRGGAEAAGADDDPDSCGDVSLQGEDAKPALNAYNHAFRDYSDANASASARGGDVREFYRTNHERQTLEFVLSSKARFFALDAWRGDLWDASLLLNSIVDESDPGA